MSEDKAPLRVGRYRTHGGQGVERPFVYIPEGFDLDRTGAVGDECESNYAAGGLNRTQKDLCDEALSADELQPAYLNGYHPRRIRPRSPPRGCISIAARYECRAPLTRRCLAADTGTPAISLLI